MYVYVFIQMCEQISVCQSGFELSSMCVCVCISAFDTCNVYVNERDVNERLNTHTRKIWLVFFAPGTIPYPGYSLCYAFLLCCIVTSLILLVIPFSLNSPLVCPKPFSFCVNTFFLCCPTYTTQEIFKLIGSCREAVWCYTEHSCSSGEHHLDHNGIEIRTTYDTSYQH